MTIAEWCVFASLMLYLLSIASVKWLRVGRFDNSKPRDPAFYEDPIAARAWRAPERDRGLSVLCGSSAARRVSRLSAKPDQRTRYLVLVIVRIAYVFTYIGDRPTLRSILWSIGFALNIAIFFMPALRHFLPI